METRFQMEKVNPKGYRGMLELEKRRLPQTLIPF